jgi:hypothetical protein
MSATKRPSKKITVESPTPIRKSPFGVKAGGTHKGIAHGDQPQRGVRVNGKP